MICTNLWGVKTGAFKTSARGAVGNFGLVFGEENRNRGDIDGLFWDETGSVALFDCYGPELDFLLQTASHSSEGNVDFQHLSNSNQNFFILDENPTKKKIVFFVDVMMLNFVPYI